MAANPNLSAAIIEIVDRALNSPKGISIDFVEEGKAIHWLQRYHTVRSGVVKRDPGSEWRTLTGRRVGSVIFLEPLDQHVLSLEIKEIE